MKHFRMIAYLRAATTEHDFEESKAIILSLANEKKLGEEEWVEEFASGLAPWKEPRISQMKSYKLVTT